MARRSHQFRDFDSRLQVAVAYAPRRLQEFASHAEGRVGSRGASVRSSLCLPSDASEQRKLQGRPLSFSLDQQDLKHALRSVNKIQLEAVPESSRGGSSAGASISSPALPDWSEVTSTQQCGPFMSVQAAALLGTVSLATAPDAASGRVRSSSGRTSPLRCSMDQPTRSANLSDAPGSSRSPMWDAQLRDAEQESCLSSLDKASNSVRDWAALAAGRSVTSSQGTNGPVSCGPAGDRSQAHIMLASPILSLGDIADGSKAQSRGSCADSFTLTPPQEFNSMVSSFHLCISFSGWLLGLRIQQTRHGHTCGGCCFSAAASGTGWVCVVQAQQVDKHDMDLTPPEALPEPCTDSPVGEVCRPREHEPVLISSIRRSDLLRGFEWQPNQFFKPVEKQSQVSTPSKTAAYFGFSCVLFGRTY
jgi:hypothetical protein